MSLHLQAVHDLSTLFRKVEYLTLIKTGKEAEVHLVKVDGEFCALKIYRENQKFSSRQNYLVLNQVADARTARAIKNRSSLGLDAINRIWLNREARILEDLYEAGAFCPELYYVGGNYLLMQYLGAFKEPAPRLIDVRLDANEAQVALTDVCQTVETLLNLGYVHGDLSAYNILWWENHAYVIDFPQVLDLRTNIHAAEKFMKDVNNLYSYFAPLVKDTTILDELHEKYLLA